MWKPTTLIFHLLETNPQLQEVLLDPWHAQETCIWANEREEPSANYRWSNWAWERTSWRWRLQGKYQSLLRNLWNIPKTNKDHPKDHNIYITLLSNCGL